MECKPVVTNLSCVREHFVGYNEQRHWVDFNTSLVSTVAERAMLQILDSFCVKARPSDLCIARISVGSAVWLPVCTD